MYIKFVCDSNSTLYSDQSDSSLNGEVFDVAACASNGAGATDFTVIGVFRFAWAAANKITNNTKSIFIFIRTIKTINGVKIWNFLLEKLTNIQKEFILKSNLINKMELTLHFLLIYEFELVVFKFYFGI